MLVCYITDRLQFPGIESQRRQKLLAKMREAASAGADYIQLREKDLPARELEALVREAVSLVRAASSHTRLLVNSRIDVAIAGGADGAHLRGDDLYPSEARAIWLQAAAGAHASARLRPIISFSCHTAAEVRLAGAHGADFAVFAPVFEKDGRAGAGLEALRMACSPSPGPGNTEGPGGSIIPVLALGGVTLENAASCVQAGAAGVAAIRLFQEHDARAVIAALKLGSAANLR